MKRLELTMNVAVILAALLVAGRYGMSYFKKTPASPPPLEAVQKGIQIQLELPKASEKSLVFFVSPSCHYCEMSVPFYRRVLAQHLSVPVYFAFRQSATLAGPWLQKNHLDGHGIFDVVVNEVSGTPTAILLDKQRRVTESWRGYLDDKGQTALMHSAFRF